MRTARVPKYQALKKERNSQLRSRPVSVECRLSPKRHTDKRGNKPMDSVKSEAKAGSILKKAFMSLLLICLGFAAGLFISSLSTHAPHKQEPLQEEAHSHIDSENEKDTLWTCSMHPQILLPKPGKCPICFMDLIPVKGDASDKGKLAPREITLSETARKLAKISTAPAKKADPLVEGRLIGKVTFDETRLGTITAWVAGRIDRLHIAYTGAFVKKGQEMAEIYSPELFSAQSELIEAVKAASAVSQGRSEIVKGAADRTAKASREKLRLLGLTQEQIEAVIRRGAPSDRITLYAPLSGFITRREVTEGLYVKTGTPIYTIADISRVWILLEAYESDLPWMKTGDPVEFSVEAIPGKTFNGKITYIDPFLNERTRTAAVRVEAENPSYVLKPGMYVTAVYRSRPEGYGRGEKAPILIPAQAPLITGKRALVYVEVPGKEGVYEGREVVLGARAGDYYLVEKGLQEGELVVTRGAFKIDSSLQITAKPSMMNEGGGPSPSGHSHGAPTPSGSSRSQESEGIKDALKTQAASSTFRKQLGDAVNLYVAVSKALAADNKDRALSASEDLLKALSAIDGKLLDESPREEWEILLDRARGSATKLIQAKDISAARKAFEGLSSAIIAAVKSFAPATEKPLFEAFCPMAFDGKGAFWIQTDQEIRNPYFGAEMLACGEIKTRLSAGGK